MNDYKPRRRLVNLKGLLKEFEGLGWTARMIYQKIHLRENPLPHKKNGKNLEFDLDKVYRWWDELPGVDHTI